MKYLNKLSSLIVVLVSASVCLYLIWLLLRVFLFDQFVIPSDSMRPTLVPGDRVIVDKTVIGARIYSDFNFNPKGGELKSWRTKGKRHLQHNDIVVFNFPHHDWKMNFVINNVFCKRCIALPGDTIWSVDGYYMNNNYKGELGIEKEQRRFRQTPDSVLPKEILNTFPFDAHFGYTIRNLPHIYIPRKGDVIRLTPEVGTYYRIVLEWELQKRITCDWEKGMVYAGNEPLYRHVFLHDYYFMAGDNVLDSNDSRYFGLVPEEYIIGVVTLVSYSKDRESGKISTERILKRIEYNKNSS